MWDLLDSRGYVIPGGEEVEVTGENREEYITLYVDYLLRSSVQAPLDAFKRGFYKVNSLFSFSLTLSGILNHDSLPPNLNHVLCFCGFQVCGGEPIKMFQAKELELLICGNPEFDFTALQVS